MRLLGLLEHSVLKPHNVTATVLLFFHSEIVSLLLYPKTVLKTSVYHSDIFILHLLVLFYSLDFPSKLPSLNIIKYP